MMKTKKNKKEQRNVFSPLHKEGVGSLCTEKRDTLLICIEKESASPI